MDDLNIVRQQLAQGGEAARRIGKALAADGTFERIRRAQSEATAFLASPAFAEGARAYKQLKEAAERMAPLVTMTSPEPPLWRSTELSAALLSTSGAFGPVYVPEEEPAPVERRIAQLEAENHDLRVEIRTLQVCLGFQGKRLTQMEDYLLD